MRYTFEHAKAVTSIAPKSLDAGAENGVAVDTAGFGDGVAIISIGAATGSPSAQTVDAKLQESANGTSGWADISGAAIVQATADNKTAEIKISRRTRAASERYIRAVITPGFTGGTSPEIPCAATIVLGNPEYASDVDNSTTGD